MEQIWNVSGLTCGHCVGSVTTELMKIVGVKEVEIVLNANEISVLKTQGDHLTADQITLALSQAGNYSLA